jgi:hypothetical protein
MKKMSKVKQIWLVLLYSFIELDGGGTKQQVLNHIQEQGYWYKNDQNDVLLPSRKEFQWRNDLAYQRFHLVKGRYMPEGEYDSWRITQEGRNHFLLLAEEAKTLEPKYITAVFLDKLFQEQIEAAADRLLFEQICQLENTAENLPVIFPEGPLPKGPAANRGGTRKTYIRNPTISKNALNRAGHKCEADPNHISFQRRNSPDLYMEPHHLIEMSMTDRFDVTLDREQNIFSLCSNCHNMIHYGTKADIRKLISKLFLSREHEVCSILKEPLTLEELYQIYSI